MTGLRFGQPAPDFSLPATSGGETRLADFRGLYEPHRQARRACDAIAGIGRAALADHLGVKGDRPCESTTTCAGSATIRSNPTAPRRPGTASARIATARGRRTPATKTPSV